MTSMLHEMKVMLIITGVENQVEGMTASKIRSNSSISYIVYKHVHCDMNEALLSVNSVLTNIKGE